ncbi:MAG: cation-transporting P-type ATPase, partial [Polyangia bacterium]|nr:cation-transporting P-type ATPase [Polyangia bacterium]
MKQRRVTSGNVMLFQGLTAAQVEKSRAEHGANVLTPPPRTPWWRELLGKFDDPIIRILMVAAAIAIAVGAVDGSYIEGIGIVCAILLATFLAFLNEYRAAREFDILNKTSDDVPVQVVRAGLITQVPRRDLVVGDIVLVEMGEEVPADGGLLEAVTLQVNESRLTGESEPTDKIVGPPP